MAKTETFSSRWGLILAGLGMAVGTGNMWRFPRIAAQNGGAAFLIPWFVFLFIWSFPLLIAEFAIGAAPAAASSAPSPRSSASASPGWAGGSP